MVRPFEKYGQLKLLIFLVFILIVYFAVHTPYLITEYFGITDAARIVNDSVKASYNSRYYDMEYGLKSSPLYSEVLRFCFKTGMISISNVSFWMAQISLLSGAAITIAIFIFVFRLTTSFLSAFGATLILQLFPIFWFSSLCGFTTIVALAFFMISLVLFQNALIDRLSICKYLKLLGALLMYIMAVMTKLDVLLASAIFCLPVWISDFSIKKKAIWIGCLVLFSGFVFLLFNQYYGCLPIVREISTTASWREHFSNWPFQFDIFYSKMNLITIARAVGVLSVPAVIIGLVLIGWRREWRFTIIWLVLSGLPLVLFWGMRPGNSARHNFVPALFLCIILVLPLTMRTWRKWVWSCLLCVTCLINYFFFPPSANIKYPSGRLFASTHVVEERVKNAHLTGRAIANLPYHEKTVVIGKINLQPYYRYEVLRSSHLSYVKHTVTYMEDETTLEMQNKKRKQLFLWLHKKLEMSEILSLARDGYYLAVCDKELANKLSNLKELQDKWVCFDQ